MKITLSFVTLLALAVVSVTSAAPTKDPFTSGKGRNRLSRKEAEILKKIGWLPSNFTEPAGGWAPNIEPLKPISIEGPSLSPSNAQSRASSKYTCPGAKATLTWVARLPNWALTWEEKNPNTEHAFNIEVTATPHYSTVIPDKKSSGSYPDYKETRETGDGRFAVTHDVDWNTGKLSLGGNGQTARWELVGRYSYYPTRYDTLIMNTVDACFNFVW
ncbi:hypothetical protein EC991_003306 [Linnemannia zychae]|nr:hypothetical protein EC991_003306 [Linnemannia zychae]